MEKTGDEACKNCRFWRPRFYQIGECIRDESPHSKIWRSNPDECSVLTGENFLCLEYEKIPEQEKNTI